MPVFPPLTVTERLQAARHRLGFEYAQRIWLRRRQRELTAEAMKRPAFPRAVRMPEGPHVVVVPQEGYAFDSFTAGTRNFYFEAWKSLAEDIGASNVSVFNVDPGEEPDVWHLRLLDYLIDVGATHVISHIESDPGSEGARWTWDRAWALISRYWGGVLLGVMFDSAFEWLAAQSRLLSRISDRFVLVDICMPMDGSMVRRRPEVGPVNMPLSRESLTLVDARLAGIAPQWDVSFIGVLYPYRMTMVERLQAAGIQVAVNPHRKDLALDDASSRIGQPSWLDYMAGLRSSRISLNFSQSSAGRFEQLKTRVLEATLAGTVLFTDDIDRTRRFWRPETEFVYFPTLEDLPYIVTSLLEDPVRLALIAEAGEHRARHIAHTHFWWAIEDVLRQRGLPLTSFGGRPMLAR